MGSAAQVERLDYSRPPPGVLTISAVRRDAAWVDYKLRHDPPGMWVSDDGEFGVIADPEHWLDGAFGGDTAEERRLALAERLWDREGGRPDFLWPRILTWSDDQLAAVERWLVDSTAEMPEVLRG